MINKLKNPLALIGISIALIGVGSLFAVPSWIGTVASVAGIAGGVMIVMKK